MNLAELLIEKSEGRPDKPAVIDSASGVVTTYAGLCETILDLARALENAGVGPGMGIALYLRDCGNCIAATYALWLLEVFVIPISVDQRDAEIETVLERIPLDGVLTDLADLPKSLRPENSEPVRISARLTFVPMVRRGRHPAAFFDLHPAFLRFSSGTTGSSKGVVLSHTTIFERINAANEVLAIGPEDTVLWVLPMAYHFTVSIVSYLTFGATVVLSSGYLGGSLVAETKAFGITFLYGSPVHYATALTYAPVHLKTVRLAISTTTTIRSDLPKRFYDRFGVHITQAYGMIEAGLPCIHTVDRERKPGSVGPVLPSFDVRLQDVQLGPGRMAISFRGPGLLDAYYYPWRPRSVVAPDGWFSTGDLGWIDSDHFLFLTGRLKEVIDIGGRKCFPQEIESVLLEHPAVVDAWVAGVPHPILGETLLAQIVLNQNASPTSPSDVRAFCAQLLSSFKVPQAVQIVDHIPRTASGKLPRRPASSAAWRESERKRS